MAKTEKKAKKSKKNSALEMLKTALVMEEKGKEFYSKEVSSCHDEMGREMFHYLMNEEILHVGRINKIFENLDEGRGWTEEWKHVKPKAHELEHFFDEMKTKHAKKTKTFTDDIKALDVGIDLETKAIKFYSDEIQKAKENLAKDFIEMMILEEKKHLEILEDMKMYLVDPEGWNARIDKLEFSGG